MTLIFLFGVFKLNSAYPLLLPLMRTNHSRTKKTASKRNLFYSLPKTSAVNTFTCTETESRFYSILLTNAESRSLSAPPFGQPSCRIMNYMTTTDALNSCLIISPLIRLCLQ